MFSSLLLTCIILPMQHLNSASYKMSCHRLKLSGSHLPLVCCSFLCQTHWTLLSVTFSCSLKLLSNLSLCFPRRFAPSSPDSEVLTNSKRSLPDWQDWLNHFLTTDRMWGNCASRLQYRFWKGKTQMLECAFWWTKTSRTTSRKGCV